MWGLCCFQSSDKAPTGWRKMARCLSSDIGCCMLFGSFVEFVSGIVQKSTTLSELDLATPHVFKWQQKRLDSFHNKSTTGSTNDPYMAHPLFHVRLCSVPT